MDKALQENILRIREQSEYLIPLYPDVFDAVIKEMTKPFLKIPLDKIAAIDMKGLLYGPVIAHRLIKPFVPVVKGNKIKDRALVFKEDYMDYTGTAKSIEIFKDSIQDGDRVLLIDDWFESGNTGKTAISLIEQLGGEVVGISVIFNQMDEKTEQFFEEHGFHYLIRLERN